MVLSKMLNIYVPLSPFSRASKVLREATEWQQRSQSEIYAYDAYIRISHVLTCTIILSLFLYAFLIVYVLVLEIFSQIVYLPFLCIVPLICFLTTVYPCPTCHLAH